ncbi:MAG TPA: hypothetical protein VIK01_26680 [Polyangiaceae bacterium]
MQLTDSGQGSGDWTWCHCTICGTYEVTGLWRATTIMRDMSDHDRVRLRGVVRRETDRLGACQTRIGTETYRSIIARNDAPRTAVDQVRRFVLHCAANAGTFGAMSYFPSAEAEAVRLYIDPDRLNDFLVAVEAAGYTGLHGRPGPALRITLTPQGWLLAEQLERDTGASDQAFVAMWFHPTMDEAFDNGFHVGLRRAGYEPFRVDRSDHNNKIDDEIISNIRKSRFLVADLTGARPNVFYEAGFAAGLGREVLYTCHADHMGYYLQCDPHSDTPPTAQSERWFDQISRNAFDVRQYQVMKWSTPDELAKKLDDRIGRLGLRLPEKTG